ncbi:MAG TPA: phosphomannomutase/phosphoglucomutase, partial [Rhodanobacteraceae bacterium]|nr:phosphomannomutase/phosphoglucomutase [Rhodanobacteraceae bacterium]
MAAKDIKKTSSASAQRIKALAARAQRALRTLLPVALGTLLFALGVFFAWQASLVWTEQSGAENADRVRASAIAAIKRDVDRLLGSVQKGLSAPAVLDGLAQGGEGGRAAASEALRQAAPDVEDVEFYSPELTEIISGDLAAFGYAKAQMLMQAQSRGEPAPVQARSEKGKGRRLVIALPVRNGTSIVAFAVVYMPLLPIVQTFHQSQISGARLDLRQGDGHGDLVIASSGSGTGSTIGDLGEPIPGTLLRVGKGEPDYFIVGPRSFGTLIALAVLCLLGGLIALWLRKVGLAGAVESLKRSPKTVEPELTLAEALKQAPAGTKAAGARGTASSTSSKPRAKDVVETPVNIDRSIFRAYDIRGVVGETLTPAVARVLGRAIGSEARDRGLKEIVVGRDGRLSGPDMVEALVGGLRATGIDVIDIGAVPTPVVYFGCYHLNTGSGISVTGSHNPPDYNGFKIVLGGETLSEDSIQALYARIAESRFVEGSGGLQTMDITGDYIQRIANDIQVERKLKVVVDCGNGIPGAIAPKVIEAIGCEVEPLYCDVDGTFPNHHPDPSDLHNLQDLILSVKQLNADIGLAFDGDGDRLGVVTKSGEVIF